MAEADTPLQVDAEIARRLAGHIEFYVRADKDVIFQAGSQRDDGSEGWVHPGPPWMRYSSETRRRSFYVSDALTGRMRQCGWDLLVKMDRPFQVRGSRTAVESGEVDDFVVLEQGEAGLVPWGVLPADHGLRRIGRPAGESTTKLKIFYSYKKSDGDRARTEAMHQRISSFQHQLGAAFYGSELNDVVVGGLEHWFDGELVSSDEWHHEIREHLVSADLVVVLIDDAWIKAGPTAYSKQNELRLAQRQRAIGRCRVMYVTVDGTEIPQEILKDAHVGGDENELGGWSTTEVMRTLTKLVDERAAAPHLPLTDDAVLGPKPESRSRVTGEWSLDPEPVSGPVLTVPPGPWCYVPDHDRMRIVTEVTPASDVPVLCSQAIVSDDGTLLLGVTGNSTELVIVNLGAAWSSRRPWRTGPQAESSAPLGVELVSATRCGREFWLLWNRDGMLYRVRLDREGIPWGERLVRSGPTRSAAYLMALERSPLQLVAVSPNGVAIDHPPRWGTALAELNIAGVATAARGCSLAAVAGADSSGDGVLRVLDITTGSVILEVRSTHRPFEAVRIAPDGSEVAGSVEGRIYRWHITKDVDLPR